MGYTNRWKLPVRGQAALDPVSFIYTSASKYKPPEACTELTERYASRKWHWNTNKLDTTQRLESR